MADWFDQQDQKSNPQSPASLVQAGKDWFDQQDAKVKAEPETPKEGSGFIDYFRHYLGQHAPALMSMLGAGAGEASPIPGGMLAGAAAGSLVGQGMQKTAPRFFGSPPQDLTGVATQTGEDVLGNVVLPKVVGFGLRNLPAVKNAIAGDVIEGATKKLDKNLYPQAATIETAAANAQSHYASLPGAKPSIPHTIMTAPEEQLTGWKMGVDPRSVSGSPYSPGTIGHQLLDIPYQQTDARINAIKDVNKTFMSDVTQVRNLKLIPGGVQTAEQLGTNNLLQKGYTPSNGRIDPDAILKELDGKNADIYSEALRPTTKQNLVDLMNSVSKAQETQASSNNLIGFVKHRMMFYAPGMLMAGSLGHEEAGAAGLILTDAALSALMKNDTVAKAVLYASKTPQGSPASQVLQHVIMNGLKGSGAYVLVSGPEDKLEKAYVDDKGQLTYQRPGQ
jgi:hypothetical protein